MESGKWMMEGGSIVLSLSKGWKGEDGRGKMEGGRWKGEDGRGKMERGKMERGKMERGKVEEGRGTREGGKVDKKRLW